MKILIIIPAYNEEENIVEVIDSIKQYCPNYDYIVINDCSTDNTKEILEKKKINYLDLPINLGIGGSVQTGYQYALENKYDIAIQFDGDGQHDAKYIEKLILPIQKGEADFVIGSRFIEKEGFQSTVMRRLGIKFLSLLIQWICGTKVKDVTSGMRAVNRKIIEKFAKFYAQDYPEPEAIVDISLIKENLIIKEVAVEMKERSGGVSSINFIRSIYYMIKVSISLIILRITVDRR